MGSVVWILGASFSKSLGAPLLSDLFSNRLGEQIRLRRGESRPLAEGQGDYTTRLEQLFNAERVARAFRDGRRGWPWADAEEFLEVLDQVRLGAQSPPTDIVNMVKDMVHGTRIFPSESIAYAQLCRLARLYLIEATTYFIPLEKGSLPSRWEPYQRWINTLDHRDAIISFNYDQVVERVDIGGKIALITPDEQGASSRTPLLKLHGSASWISKTSDLTASSAAAVGAGIPLADKDAWPAILAPGPSKRPSTDCAHRLGTQTR